MKLSRVAYLAEAWLLRAAGIAVACAVLAGCTSTGFAPRSTPAMAVASGPALDLIPPSPVAAPAPRTTQTAGVAAAPASSGEGSTLLGKPYQMAGKWYTPRHEPDYKATGLASWYGPEFHGRQTANGEIFDQDGLTAAHPTLPLPSYVRVTNLDNDASVIVRVNDRGPFSKRRLIDVSHRTAELLGFKGSGVASVEVEYLEPAPAEGRDQSYLLASFHPPSGMARQSPAVMTAFAEPQRPSPRPSRGLLGGSGATTGAVGGPFEPYRPEPPQEVETVAFDPGEGWAASVSDAGEASLQLRDSLSP